MSKILKLKNLKQAQIYVTTKPITVNATYWEPIYDDHPDIGSYSRDIHITIPKNSRVFLDENGNLKDVFACGRNITQEYGVSVHSGCTTFRQNLNSLIGNAIKIVSEEEWYRIWEIQSTYNEYYEEFCHNSEICANIEWDAGVYLAEDIAKVVTEKDYEEMSARMWSNAFNYVDHMVSSMHAWRRTQECKLLGAA